MAKLKAAERNALPAGKFAEPSKRAYPIPDRNHAKNAKARASEMEHKGKLSKGEETKIDKAADRVLGRSKKK